MEINYRGKRNAPIGTEVLVYGDRYIHINSGDFRISNRDRAITSHNLHLPIKFLDTIKENCEYIGKFKRVIFGNEIRYDKYKVIK
jgi:hypothetical protein